MQLVVDVIEAEGLAASDRKLKHLVKHVRQKGKGKMEQAGAEEAHGGCDPFCSLQIVRLKGDATSWVNVSYKQKTGTVVMSSEPHWKENFVFPGSFFDSRKWRSNVTEHSLLVRIYDRDTFTKNDPLGHCLVQLGDVPHGKGRAKWFPLMGEGGQTGGRVKLRLHLDDGKHEHMTEGASSSGAGKVNVNLCSRQELDDLPGIGSKTVEKILLARPFVSMEDLARRVPGFGAGKVAKLTPVLCGWVTTEEAKKAKKKQKKKVKVDGDVHGYEVLGTQAERNKANSRAAARKANGTLLIASWNVRNLGVKKDEADLVKIACVILEYDVVALQEIRGPDVVERLRALLGSSWLSSVSDDVGTDERKERYAFLWRKRRAEMIGSPALLDDAGDLFVREPYLGFFRAGGFDFVLCTIHVLWGKKKAERRAEVAKLDELLHVIQRRARKEKDIILVGDFNMPPTDLSWQIAGWTPLVTPPMTTLVGDTSLYDNIWISDMHTGSREYTGRMGVRELDVELFPDTLLGRRLCSSILSDHRPVWASFYTNLDDDDVQAAVNLSKLTIRSIPEA